MIPLIMLTPHTKAIIVRLNGGKNFFEKMNSLGIYKGAEIEIINKFHNGPIIIKIGESRLAIGRRMAERIFVRISN